MFILNNFLISDMMDVDVDYYCKGNEIMLIFICEKIFYFNDFYYIIWKYEKRLI